MTDQIMFFGGAWDSPAFDAGTRVQFPTPVGTPCFWCHEEIKDGDRGLMRPCFTLKDGLPDADLKPIHVECDLRQVMGSVAHLEGRCRCHGVTEQDYPGGLREEALEVLVRVNRLRANQGMGPLWKAP